MPVEINDPRLLKKVRALTPEWQKETREARMLACAVDPLAFALTYLTKHITDVDKTMSLSLIHWDWVNLATELMIHQQPNRISLVAPRDSGKSTWWFLIIPLWAAAFGHSRFVAAFADSGPQAEVHLMTFKHELDTNELLRADFPTLCTPARRPSSGGNVADNRSLMVCANGFAFKATGIDASNLGLKVNEARPDFIIFDDIEPDEANYSAYQAKKRLGTVTDAVLPMNHKARVVFTGTVTMVGGITHQLVNSVAGNEETEVAEWIKDENVQCHYYPPILTTKAGVEISIWPQKWPMEYLQKIRHTRSFAKNFQNKPLSADGDYWSESDFNYGVPGPVTHTMLSVDGAVTTKRTSDYTGLAVVSYRPPIGERLAVLGFTPCDPNILQKPGVIVWSAVQVKLAGEFLRQRALDIIEECEETDHPIRMLYVEVNQGGDLWLNLFHDMPIPVNVITAKAQKEVRAAKTLQHYQRDRVWHAVPLSTAEEQMAAYPDVAHDDIIDAIGQGVAYYAKRSTHQRSNKGLQTTSLKYAREAVQ